MVPRAGKMQAVALGELAWLLFRFRHLLSGLYGLPHLS